MGLRPMPTAWGSPLAPVLPAGGTPVGGRGGGSSGLSGTTGGNIPIGGEQPQGSSAIGGSSGGGATPYGGYGGSSTLTGGSPPASVSLRTIYHGTSSASASRILKKGFRSSDDIFFAPDYRTAQAFAIRGGGKSTVMVFKIPIELYEAIGFKEGPIGEYSGVRPPSMRRLVATSYTLFYAHFHKYYQEYKMALELAHFVSTNFTLALAT